MAGSKTRDAKREATTKKAFLDALQNSKSVIFNSVYALAIEQKRDTQETYQKLATELGLGPLANYDIYSLVIKGSARKIIEDARRSASLLNGGTGTASNTQVPTGSSATSTATPSTPAAAANNIISANSKWPDSSYRYNLPPHSWSRLERTAVQPSRDQQDFNPDDFHPKTDLRPQLSSLGASRRGLIWWYQAQTYDTSVVSDTVNADDATIEKTILESNNSPGNRKFGFMFPWNPTEVSFSTALASDIKDSATDDYLGYAGAPGAQSMTLAITINRQDDFACLAGLAKQYGVQIPQLSTDALATLHPYYNEDSRLYTESKVPLPTDNFLNQVKELSLKGTLHDVEYLYRTINGKGWTKFGIPEIGGLGSADVGYLMFTLVNVALGPMVYSGVIRGINVVHAQFSTNMTPIISTVSLTIDIRSTLAMNTSAGTTSSGADGSLGAGDDQSRRASGQLSGQ